MRRPGSLPPDIFDSEIGAWLEAVSELRVVALSWGRSAGIIPTSLRDSTVSAFAT